MCSLNLEKGIFTIYIPEALGPSDFDDFNRFLN